MVIIKLIKQTVNKVVYSYQPEGKGKPGIIAFNLKDHIVEDWTVELLAENDRDTSMFYRKHVIGQVIKMAKDGVFLNEYTRAWY